MYLTQAQNWKKNEYVFDKKSQNWKKNEYVFDKKKLKMQSVLLVVCLCLDPATWIPPEQVLSRLIIGEDEQGEWQGRQPPVELQRIHPEPLVHARTIGSHV